MGKMHFKKDGLIIIAILIVSFVMYGLTLRGEMGNPTSRDVTSVPASAFESSHEKGPYGHVVSLVETGSYALSKDWADLAMPDVGTYDGKFYAFFAPGVPYYVLPFYVVGEKFGAAQLFTYAAESLVSTISLIFLYMIGRRVFSLPRWAAFFAVLVFGFASTSWSYAITLYQNAFTTFFMVTAFYAAWQYYTKNESKLSFLYAGYVWAAYALAIFVDYPNAIQMLPIMVFLAYATFQAKVTSEGVIVSVRWASILAAIFFVGVTMFHFAHNSEYFGGWSRVAGTLQNYVQAPDIVRDTDGAVVGVEDSALPVPDEVIVKTISGTFFEKLVPNGLYILLISDERGLLYYSPIFIFALLGLWSLLLRKKYSVDMYIVPLALIVVNIIFYASWGDPWGGWSFGPRYIIPSMAWLALLVAIGLHEGGKWFEKGVAYVFVMYSSAVALLGALTTNMIPTKGDSLLMPTPEHSFDYTVRFMESDTSSSFIYNTYFADSISLIQYFGYIFVTLAVIVGITLFFSSTKQHGK